MSAGSAAMAPGAHRLGIIMLVAVAFAWGFNWPAMKIIVREVPLWQFRAVTGAVGAALLFLLAWALGQKIRVPRRQWAPLCAAALFNVTGWFALVGYGITLMASGHAAVLAFTTPIWVALLGAIFLGQRLTRRHFVSLALGVAGVAVLLSHDLSAVGSSPVGAAVIIAGAIAWASGVLIQKRIEWQIGPVAQAAWQLSLGIVPLAIVAAATETFVYHTVSAAALAASAYLAVISIAFAYYAWFTLVQIFPAHVASIGSLMVPVVGAISAAIILGEPFGWREVAALVLVVGAVGLVMLFPGAPPAAATPPPPPADGPPAAAPRP